MSVIYCDACWFRTDILTCIRIRQLYYHIYLYIFIYTYVYTYNLIIIVSGILYLKLTLETPDI